jgi:tetratricopeptide (TPR) repeat protein
MINNNKKDAKLSSTTRREFYERLYIEHLIPIMQEEKDYVNAYLMCKTLASHLPYAQRLWMYWAQCHEKLGLHSSAVRCSIIGLHIHPTHQPSLRYAIQLLQHSSSRMADELRMRQYSLSPVDFDLCYHYFRQLMHKKLFHEAFVFILHYFVRKTYLSDDDLLTGKYDVMELLQQQTRKYPLSQQDVLQFKTVAQQFVGSKQYKYAIQLWQLAISLAPNQPALYFSLFEVYEKMKMYLDAFKAYALYMYITSLFGTNISTTDSDLVESNVFSSILASSSHGSIEQYQKCGDLLEKSNCYYHAILAYYQCHLLHIAQINLESNIVEEESVDRYNPTTNSNKQTIDELLVEYDNLDQIEHNEIKSLQKKYQYLIYIRNNLLPKLLDQQKNNELVLSERANELINDLIQNSL